VTAGWNAGPFMVVHRDHGWSEGWGTPGFGTADVEALTNGANLPVVLSINCSSAAYDYDETSFVGESLVNPNGGAVGAFGDTRDSPTWHNSQIALGFADALLPSILPAEGPATAQRTGQALINGKLRLAGLSPPSGPGITGGDGNTRNELYLWHYFGDPSMQMWGGTAPRAFALSEFTAKYVQGAKGDPAPYHVDVTLPKELAGQPVSLVQNGQVIGRAIAGDGTATVPADFDDDNVNVGTLRIAIDADRAKPISVPVQGTTSLTQTCPAESVDVFSNMVITGNLVGAPAGSDVVVTYDPPNDPPFTRTVQTDANGNWSSTVIPNNESNDATGTWTVQSSYAGDASHAGAASSACSVQVIDLG
jgi:hypothetical protein